MAMASAIFFLALAIRRAMSAGCICIHMYIYTYIHIYVYVWLFGSPVVPCGSRSVDPFDRPFDRQLNLLIKLTFG